MPQQEMIQIDRRCPEHGHSRWMWSNGPNSELINRPVPDMRLAGVTRARILGDRANFGHGFSVGDVVNIESRGGNEERYCRRAGDEGPLSGWYVHIIDLEPIEVEDDPTPTPPRPRRSSWFDDTDFRIVAA